MPLCLCRPTAAGESIHFTLNGNRAERVQIVNVGR
jgi:hypothetical protein